MNYWQNHFEFYHQWTKGSRLVTQVNWKALLKEIIPLKELTDLTLVQVNKSSQVLWNNHYRGS